LFHSVDIYWGLNKAPGIELTSGDKKMNKIVPIVKMLDSLIVEGNANSENHKSPSEGL